MRLVSRFIATSFFFNIALLALPCHLFSQESGSRPIVTVADTPPDAPTPQLAIAEAASLGQQALAGQTPKSQAQNPTSPSSSNSQPPEPQTGNIGGTVTDMNGGSVPGATVVFKDSVIEDRRTVVANDSGFFESGDLKLGIPYRVTISAKGFIDWTSPAIVLKPGQVYFLKDINLQVAGEVTSVTVYSSNTEIATEQVNLEERQRVLGIVPNFYVVYDHNPAPLTTKLKFKLALRLERDPIVFLGDGFMAGINQAVNIPNYVQGAKGFGQRMGTQYADGFTDILFGGAILPSLLHQDPRYYYQGMGTIKSRTSHALANAFICKGDNGRSQINYSSIGGDLISSSISNAYYPETNRGVGLVFNQFLISTAERVASSLAQEFVLGRFTHKS